MKRRPVESSSYVQIIAMFINGEKIKYSEVNKQ